MIAESASNVVVVMRAASKTSIMRAAGGVLHMRFCLNSSMTRKCVTCLDFSGRASGHVGVASALRDGFPIIFVVSLFQLVKTFSYTHWDRKGRISMAIMSCGGLMCIVFAGGSIGAWFGVMVLRVQR